MRCALVMTARLHDELQRQLFPGDGLEAAAVILCAQGSGKQRRRLIANKIIALPPQRSKRRRNFLSWPFADHFPPETITDIDQRGLSIVTVHSHPGGLDQFSPTDDKNDRKLFPSVCNWFDDGRPNGAAIMLPSGKMRARVVDADGEFHDMDSVAVVGDNIHVWSTAAAVDKSAVVAKLAQTFGTGTINLLRSLRVGVVGCSGTGSVVIELLARNCIGELVIVDNDRMEEKNLNRIINGTAADAKRGIPKAQMLKNAIEKVGLGTKVDAFCELTDSPSVVAALVDCDVIFGCMDSFFGRYHLDCISSAYCIPYFDVGVRLDADGKGSISAADTAAHYMHPEGKSLFARGGYTMEHVEAENYRRTDPAYYHAQCKAGYLAAVGEEQPAVMSVNMQAACMAFNDFLARVHRFRLDDNREFSVQRFRIAHGHYENGTEDGPPDPLFAKCVLTGDKSFLIKNNTRHDNAP